MNDEIHGEVPPIDCVCAETSMRNCQAHQGEPYKWYVHPNTGIPEGPNVIHTKPLTAPDRWAELHVELLKQLKDAEEALRFYGKSEYAKPLAGTMYNHAQYCYPGESKARAYFEKWGKRD